MVLEERNNLQRMIGGEGLLSLGYDLLVLHIVGDLHLISLDSVCVSKSQVLLSLG